MAKVYAGIGSRQTPPEILELMKEVAYCLAKVGWILNTGAAKGADQAFGSGAAEAGGRINLYLPWDNYERDWWSKLDAEVSDGRANVQITVLGSEDKEAIASVKKYHPAYDMLSEGARRLHARNYLIVKSARFIVCWTKNAEVVGGTGQALRIAKDLGIPVYNLADEKDRKKVENYVKKCKK